MKKVPIYIFLAMVLIGTVVSYFSTIDIVDYIALAVAFGGAGALCATTIGKAEKKDWKMWFSIVAICLGAFGLGFCGVATETVTKLMSAVIGVILLIVGIIPALVSIKKK